MTIKEWRQQMEAQGITNITTLYREAIAQPIIDTTQESQVVNRSAALVACEQALLQLLAEADISPSGATLASVTATLNARISATTDVAEKVNISVLGQKLMAAFLALMQAQGSLTDPYFGHPSYTIERTVPVYGDSILTQNGWTDNELRVELGLI